MDPLSQAALGAAAPLAFASRKQAAAAALFGALGGMAPDLDVLIRSSTDPLLFLEYHRQFTHSLFFIPFGGLIVGSLLFLVFGRRWGLSFKTSVLFTTAGYATHALLDACTTYGTLLLWPFTDARYAWNTISVIDPLFTAPVLILVLWAAISRKPLLARYALIWAIAYPTLGAIQRERAESTGEALAQSRGHVPVRLEAKPSFGNILLWKIVYETEQRYYVDAVRAGLTPQLFEGETIEKLNIARDLPWLQPETQQARDIERFRWFSNGYIARDPAHDWRIIDIRYSMLPNRADGLWGIQLQPAAAADAHVLYESQRNADEETLQRFRAMLLGN